LNSAIFHSVLVQTSCESAAGAELPRKPIAVIPAAAVETKDLRVTFFMLILLERKIFWCVLVGGRIKTEAFEKRHLLDLCVFPKSLGGGSLAGGCDDPHRSGLGASSELEEEERLVIFMRPLF
jgi:hypothetical protein